MGYDNTKSTDCIPSTGFWVTMVVGDCLENGTGGLLGSSFLWGRGSFSLEVCVECESITATLFRKWYHLYFR